MTKRASESATAHDPYAGNSLIAQLGPIRSRPETLKALVEFPPRPPKDIATIPRHVRLHMLMSVRDLHVPSVEELQLYETMDMMIRQNYHHLQPSSSSTWSMISGEEARYRPPVTAPTYGAAVVGVSGSGKTQAIRRCLSTFPQTIQHTSFFRMVNGLQQVVWLSLDVPAGGGGGGDERARGNLRRQPRPHAMSVPPRRATYHRSDVAVHHHVPACARRAARSGGDRGALLPRPARLDAGRLPGRVGLLHPQRIPHHVAAARRARPTRQGLRRVPRSSVLLSGRLGEVFDEIVKIKEICADKAHLKVIFETGELVTYDNVRKASYLAMLAGGDFIKTSTGKVAPAATPPVVMVMLEAVRDFRNLTGVQIGVKPAGGIRTTKDAIKQLVLVNEVAGPDWLTNKYFRIGASALLNDLLMQRTKLAEGYYSSHNYVTVD